MERRTDRTLFRSAAVLLVVAAAGFGLNNRLFAGIDWTPLRIPVELVEGRDHEGDFVAPWGVVYEIHLDTERNLPLQEQNCLLGIESVVPERCARMSSELILSWQVTANAETLARGESQDSQAGYWGPSMGKILGAFQARQGQRYGLTATVGRSSPELQRSNPSLQVSVAPRERKWTYVWAGLLIAIATCSLLLAIVLSAILARRAYCHRGH
jgi:hypothetical protein